MAPTRNNRLAAKTMRQVIRPVAIPSQRTRIPKMDKDSSLVVSRFFAQTLTTAAAAQNYIANGLSPALAPTNDPGGAVIRNYSEYRYKNATLLYTPLVGTTTAGIVWSAYFDNPEIVYKITAGTYTLAQISALVQNCPGAVCGPVWQPHELKALMVMRRKWYNVDSTTPASISDADLAVHGMFVSITVGCPFSTSVGVTQISYAAEGHRLQTAAVSGI